MAELGESLHRVERGPYHVYSGRTGQCWGCGVGDWERREVRELCSAYLPSKPKFWERAQRWVSERLHG